jgi:hypothetical protein
MWKQSKIFASHYAQGLVHMWSLRYCVSPILKSTYFCEIYERRAESSSIWIMTSVVSVRIVIHVVLWKGDEVRYWMDALVFVWPWSCTGATYRSHLLSPARSRTDCLDPTWNQRFASRGIVRLPSSVSLTVCLHHLVLAPVGYGVRITTYGTLDGGAATGEF